MARNVYLRLCGGRWTWRRRVPRHLVALFGKHEIIRSLGPTSKPQAQRRARELTVLSDQLFRKVESTPGLTKEQIEALVREWFTRRLDGLDQARETAGANDHDEFERYADAAQRHADGASELSRRGDMDAVQETVEALLAHHGIDLQAGTPAFQDLCRGVLRANVEARRIDASRFSGDFSARPSDPILTAHEAPQAVAQPLADATPPTPKFTQLWRKYVEEKTTAGDWGPEMLRENRVSSEIFLDVCGDMRLDDYTRTIVSGYVGALRSLPRYRGQDRRLVGLSPRKQIEFAEKQPGIELIGQKSIKKHFSNISSFFGWCKRQGYIDINPAEGVFQYKRGKRRQDERDAWTPGQLRTLFASPLYQGSHPHFRAREGEHIIQDALYWLPLLAAFHPIRLEEGAQLRVKDVKQHEGITYLDIHGTDDENHGAPARKVKSLAAWRKVPLHETVIEVGFLDYIERRRRNGDRMVFDLEPGGAAQRYGQQVTKKFTYYRKALALDGLTFHGLRHTAITALGNAEVYPNIINKLDGHEISGELGRYMKDFSLSKLREAINKIEYPGITAHLIAGGKGKKSTRDHE